MPSIEEAHQRVMAAWRGHVNEETMLDDLRVAYLAVLEEATAPIKDWLTNRGPLPVSFDEHNQADLEIWRELHARIEELGR